MYKLCLSLACYSREPSNRLNMLRFSLEKTRVSYILTRLVVGSETAFVD